jgi:AraC-like DNA-binding protein
MKDQTKLHWTVLNGVSILSFAFGKVPIPEPCVSSYSSELTILLDGEVIVEYGPVSQHVRLKPYEGCLITKGTPHRCYCTPGTRVVVVDVFADFGDIGVGKLNEDCLDASLLRRLEQYCEGSLDPTGFAECMWHAERQRPCIRSIEHTQSTQRMLSVKSYLEENFANPIHVTALADRFRQNIDYLIREFRKSFYFTPFAYVNFLRHQQFSWTRLQLGTREPLIRGALDAGFHDYATFCRKVRTKYGTPPSKLFGDLRGARQVPRASDGESATSCAATRTVQ